RARCAPTEELADGGERLRRWRHRIAIAARARGLCFRDELAHAGVHRFTPSPSAEHTVVPRAPDGHGLFELPRNSRAELVHRMGLSGPGDVVELAFDAQHRRFGDDLGGDELALHAPEAARQLILLEHDPNAVEVVLGGHVEHRVVLVVEAAVRRSILEIAPNQVLIEVPVRAHVPPRVHGDEASVLQKAGINAATLSRVVGWHLVHEARLEPAEWLAG